MNEVVAGHPGREIHVVLDNLNTRKPKDDRWLKRHPNVHLHITPTYNERATPFEWRKAVVFPSAPKLKYSDLCN